MRESFYYMYALGDPRDGEIFYVGRTRNLVQRWTAHMSAWSWLKARNPAYADRMFELRRAGVEPVLVVLEWTADSMRESHFIQKLGGAYALANIRQAA